jgi:hypothetical protein
MAAVDPNDLEYKIGQRLKTKEEVKLTTIIGNQTEVWPVGTELFVTASNHFLFPDGKLMALPREIKTSGYDANGIAELIFRSLKRNTHIKDMMEDYDEDEKYIKDAIVEALDQLWIM